MSHELRAIQHKPRAESRASGGSGGSEDAELLRRADELRDRLTTIRTVAAERSARLRATGSQSREIFDALESWLRFFDDAFAQCSAQSDADRPPADLTLLKRLISEQHALNARVTVERAAVRDLLAEASHGSPATEEKIEVNCRHGALVYRRVVANFSGFEDSSRKR